MGIHNLARLIADVAPGAMKDNEIKNYFGRKIAIDASMCIYQFLIAIRSDGTQMTNDEGETTSHLIGLFYRTIRMLEAGIKPVYVFDGKPPDLKSGELVKRKERREEAEKELAKAKESGDAQNVEKFERRLVRVTKQHNEECKTLLGLMGVPHVSAPGEAEAQCSELVKGGKVYAVGTEDMDALTFGGTVLLRHLTASEAKKLPVQEINLPRVLDGFDLNHEEFIDLCIMMGCDYCGSIKGIGMKKSIELIKKHKTIDKVLESIDQSKYPPPEDWLFKEARVLFKKPDVTPADECELKWKDPNEDELVKYMCSDKGFSEERIRNGIKKIKKARQGSTQGRLDSFFKVLPSTKNVKRKSDESKGSAKKKAKTGGGGKWKAR